MPPETEKQKKFMQVVAAAKEGSTKVTGAAKEAAKGMTMKQIKHFTSKKPKKNKVTESISNIEKALEFLKITFNNNIGKIQEFITESKVSSFKLACIKFGLTEETKQQLIDILKQPKTEMTINENYNAKYNEYIERFTVLTEKKKVKQRLDPKCWKGYHKEGTKMKGGKRVNNCVKNRK